MMETSEIIKYGITAAGILVMCASFWYHSVRKMTVNLAVIWAILGVILVVIGNVPVFSSWARLISVEAGLGLSVVGAVGLWGGFQLSLLASRITMKNQEIAIQAVSYTHLTLPTNCT